MPSDNAEGAGRIRHQRGIQAAAACESAIGIAQPPQASTSSRIGEIAAKNRSRLIVYTL